jgi:ribosomal protein L29
MKKNDLTIKDRSELELMLQELRGTLAQLTFDLADKKLKRTSDIRKTKLQIARVLTRLADASAKRAAITTAK